MRASLLVLNMRHLLSSRAPSIFHSKRSFSSIWTPGALDRLSSPSVTHDLLSRGYAVVDNVLDPDVMAAVRKELNEAECSGLMRPNFSHLLIGDPNHRQSVYVEKKGIVEIELSDPKLRHFMPTMASIQEDRTFLEVFANKFPQLELKIQGTRDKSISVALIDLCLHRLGSIHFNSIHALSFVGLFALLIALKGQINEGDGACFAIHSDSDRGADQRQLSCVVYLNEKWMPEHGGEIRLYPFPYLHVDVAPLAGRMVLFSSPNILHRVLPAMTRRYCFTIWLYGTGPREIDGPAPAVADAKEKEFPWEVLLCPQRRKLLARLVYAEEWSRSIKQSHLPSHELDILLQEHENNVQVIRRVLAPYLPIIDQYLPIRNDESVPHLNMSDVRWLG